MKTGIISELHREFKGYAEPEYKKAQQWFFKEGIELYGVRLGTVRKIARERFKEINLKTKEHVFELCEQLLQTPKQEPLVVAFQWASKMEKEFTPSDFKLFERWLKKYVKNWAACDDLCTGPFGELLVRYPHLIRKIIPWRHSKNRWVRRAAAVSLIPLGRTGKYTAEVFEAADALLTDTDDIVQKGYGWLLKETSNARPKEVFKFVIKRKDKMPRTALRYAIEKLSQSWRLQAMQK